MEWTKYTTKEALKDNDELMILDKDANANKRTMMDKIWDYVVDKMTTAVIAKLGTTDKTLIGAVNELNSKRPCLQQIFAGGDYKNCDDLPAGESATVYSSAINRPSTSKTWYLFCYASDSFKTQIAIDVTNPCNICYRILNRLDGNNQWTTWASK